MLTSNVENEVICGNIYTRVHHSRRKCTGGFTGYYYGVYTTFVFVLDRTGPKHFAVAFFKHCEKMQYSTVYTPLEHNKTKFPACVHTA